MGRIMLATSASTDEEYGGTFPLDASDIPYSDGVSTKTKIDSLVDGGFIITNTGSAEVTFSSSRTQIGSNTTITLKKGTYLIIGSLTASWSYASGQCAIMIEVDGEETQVTSVAKPQSVAPVMMLGSKVISTDGSHTIKVYGRTTHSDKLITVNNYQDIRVGFIKIA